MKKLSFMLLALLTVTLFTACGYDDKPENRQTVSMVINNRAIDGDQVVFSQANAKVEMNYTDMEIQINTEYKDVTEHSHTISTPTMALINMGGSVYSFGTSNNGEISGYIDFATGMTWFIINDNAGPVICTSQLLYAYTTTSVNNPDNGNHNSHEHSAYLFVLDSKCEKCILKISNFIPNIAGSVEASEVQFNDLTVTPTATGYTITAAQAEASNKSYTITDLNVNLSSQCQVINGSFKCKDLDFAIMGKVFPNVNWAEPF
jgi:hypothetical protein